MRAGSADLRELSTIDVHFVQEREQDAHSLAQRVHGRLELPARTDGGSMAYLLGEHRGLAQCATPSGHFVVLALDHRQNLRRELRPDDPSSVSLDEMRAFKVTVLRALAASASGVLVDPEIGIGPAIADDSVPGRTGLIIAIEATGYEGRTTARTSRVLPGWSVAAAARSGASAVKLLLYYHPDSPTASGQEALLRRVADECREVGLPLFVEPLSYSLDGEPLRGDERRRVVIATAQRLTAIGGDVLKAEFPYEAAVGDEARWRDACAELDAASTLPWVLLSGGADDDRFADQVRVACAAGASGALAGRSVWSDATRLAEPARTAFLEGAARERLERLAAVIEEHGRPWLPRWVSAKAPTSPGEGWYAST
jgi:tagatose 1,6-diphosphate aldolase